MKIYKVTECMDGNDSYFTSKKLANAFVQALVNDDAEPDEIEVIEVDETSITVPSGRKAKLSEEYWLDPLEEEPETDIGDQHIWKNINDNKLYRIYEVKPQKKTGGKFYEAEPYPQGIDNGQVKIKKLKNLNDFVKVGRR